MIVAILETITMPVLLLIAVAFGWALRDMADRSKSVISKATRTQATASGPAEEEPLNEKGRWRP